MIYIHNVKKSRKRLAKEYDNSVIINVSSKSKLPYLKLSPFYPHGNIPVPFSEGTYSESIEGIWQGLKVFDKFDIDTTKFSIRTMSGIKRPTRFYGKPLGHRKGVNGDLINYLDARKLIYIPTYLWVLKNKASDIISTIYKKALKKDIVLLDYTTNENIEDLSKPLSHASLIKQLVIQMDPIKLNKKFSSEESKKNNGQTKLNFE